MTCLDIALAAHSNIQTSLIGAASPPQEQRDAQAQAQLEAKLLEKLARADIIAEQRHSIAEELQRMRKDIAQQEAWVKARPQPRHASHTCGGQLCARLVCRGMEGIDLSTERQAAAVSSALAESQHHTAWGCAPHGDENTWQTEPDLQSPE